MSEDNSRAGYVYVLEFSETQVKIGKTTREPDERAGEWELPLLHYAWASSFVENVTGHMKFFPSRWMWPSRS